MKSSEEERGYEALSPFELKNKLITMAQTHHERIMLNAGPGIYRALCIRKCPPYHLGNCIG